MLVGYVKLNCKCVYSAYMGAPYARQSTNSLLKKEDIFGENAQDE